MSDDSATLGRIEQLVKEEHELTTKHGAEGLSAAERDRMRELEVALDQCWDLLRQRRARREYGEDPEDAQPRGERTVEGYLQ
jgi:hypothetical protein